MDTDMYDTVRTLGPVIPVIVGAALTVWLGPRIIIRLVSRSQSTFEAKAHRLDRLTPKYANTKGFLTNNIEELDEQTIQFYGNVLNSDLKPGMRLWLDGIDYEIQRVYADDEHEEVADSSLLAGSRNAVIVFKDLTKDQAKGRDLFARFETGSPVLFTLNANH